MAKTLLLLAEGFEEIEAVTVADVLRRAEIEVLLVAVSESPVRGSHGIAILADATLAQVDADAFDALILPGGMPGAKTLREDERVLSVVRRFAEAGKLTAAICAGPTVLEAAGILKGIRATSFPGHALPSALYVEEDVVSDGTIVTSRGPATALEFALKLVERIRGAETERKHRKQLLAVST